MSIGRLLSDWTHHLIDRAGLNFVKPYIGGFASPGDNRAETQGTQAAVNHMIARLAPSASGQDLQAEARQIISEHTGYLFNLDEEGLGRNLAGRVDARPELVRAVFGQLGSSDRVQVARALVGALSDDQLRSMVWSEDGRALLVDINRWVANNSLTSDGRAQSAQDRRLRERIGVALTRTDDVTLISTQQLQNPQAVRARGAQQIFPPRYTADDVRRIFGRDAYTRLDDWVNVVARGEGSFTDAAILRDNAGLSVGIKQWTQNSGRLGELMQRYRDVAEGEGRVAEFHQAFAGRENAERLLQTLRTNPQSIRSGDIQNMFAEAGRRTIFQRAQIEMAREEVGAYVREVAQDHPYSRGGTVSAQSMATSLIVRNVGPNLRDNVYRETINELYNELVNRSPGVREQVRGRQVTDDLKREIVTAHVSERNFNERLTGVAPRVLYTSPANYRAHARGLENRLRSAINMFPPEERVDPNRL